MKLLAALGILLALATVARADMYQDGSNAKVPTTGTPTGAVCTTSGGALIGLADGCATPPAVVVPTLAALKALSVSTGKVAFRQGFTTPGDGGEALYQWAASSCSVADNGWQVASNTSGCWIQSAPYVKSFDASSFGVVPDGSTSADLALGKALVACAAVGGRLYLPPGQIKMTGAQTDTIKNCHIIGTAVLGPQNGVSASYGTTILLTSTSVAPFIVGSNWAIEGVNFFWPGQTGAVSFPPLWADNGGNPASFVTLDKVAIINAYDGFAQTAGVDASDWNISNSYFYAVNDLFRVNQSGDSWRFVNVHFTHGLWANVVGYPTVAAYLNAGDQTNSIFHVTAGNGFVASLVGTTTFAWRYGLRIDNNASFLNSKIDGLWDGVETWADTSAGANACLNNTTFTGSGWASYVPVFDTSGGVTTSGNAPAFNLGAGGASCHGPLVRGLDDSGPTNGSFMISVGQEIDIDGSAITLGAVNDGSDYYAAHITANSGGSTVSFTNNTIAPGALSAHTHGVTNDVGMNKLVVNGNQSLNLNEFSNLVTGTVPIQIGDNNVRGTTGTQSVIFTGTGPVSYYNNVLDKPPVASVSSCGSGATISGAISGAVQVGSTNPTMSCTITLPWVTPGASCNFTSTAAALFVTGLSGAPASWTVSSAAELHGSQIFFNCPGSQ